MAVINGTPGSDNLVGTNGGDLIRAGRGNDRISDLGGEDFVFGGAGRDVLTLGGGNAEDYFDGGAGRDMVILDLSSLAPRQFTVFFDAETGFSGAPGVTAGRDFLVSVEDYRLIGTFDSVLVGSAASNSFRTAGGNDTLFGRDGDDRLLSRAGDDALFGGAGDDRLVAGGGRDTLIGGDGDDRLVGGGGRDALLGLDGDDTMRGGGGGDEFVFFDNFDVDVIVDFDPNRRGEWIDLAEVSAIRTYRDLRDNHLGEVAGDAVISVGNANSITLDGVSVAELSRGDFVF